MKKILCIIIAMCLNTLAFTQDDKLPSKIDDIFKAKYPKAKNVNWISDSDNYKIEFELSSNSYTAIYSIIGIWIETSKSISNSEIPVKVSSIINKKYPDSEISYAEFVENAKGEKFYR